MLLYLSCSHAHAYALFSMLKFRVSSVAGLLILQLSWDVNIICGQSRIVLECSGIL